jgi:hypothetical protein
MKKMNIENNAELVNIIIDSINTLYESKRLVEEMDDKQWSTVRLNYYANDVISHAEELNKQIRDEIYRANNYVVKDKGNMEYANGIIVEPDVDEYGDI